MQSLLGNDPGLNIQPSIFRARDTAHLARPSQLSVDGAALWVCVSVGVRRGEAADSIDCECWNDSVFTFSQRAERPIADRVCACVKLKEWKVYARVSVCATMCVLGVCSHAGRASAASLTTHGKLCHCFSLRLSVCVPSATHPFLCLLLPGQPRIFLGQLLSLET